MALRVLASSFHADAATEARERFTEAAFIKQASRPRHPWGLEQRDREGRGWRLPLLGGKKIQILLAGVGSVLEAAMAPWGLPSMVSQPAEWSQM